MMSGEHEQDGQERLRIAVLLSGSGRSLENLLNVIERGELDAEIVAVVSSKPAVRGLDIARQASIPSSTFVRRDFASDDEFSKAVLGWVESFRPHLLIFAGYLRKLIVPPRWDRRILNIHPALLPESGFGGKGFYGQRVHAAVLASGATISGATVHIVDNEYDHGPVVMRAEVPVLPGDTPDTLAARVFDAEQAIFPAAIRAYVNEHHWLLEPPIDGE
jgi:formyltetrahydrofolate-dependent phosphoribosylglycinamide formyltransferase